MGPMVNLLKYWLRRSDGLPPGQRSITTFPRFGADANHPPPSEYPGVVEITAWGMEPFEVKIAEIISEIEPVERRSDFHCVTTWSSRGHVWGGVPMAAFWRMFIEPRGRDVASAPFMVVRGTDRYRAVFRRDDLLNDDVMLATSLDGAPLDARHGAPLRLVSPSQYGYKSVKHVDGIVLHESEPKSKLGAIEHLRARVALEERHRSIPGRLLRLPYRLLIAPTAIAAERSLRRGTHSA